MTQALNGYVQVGAGPRKVLAMNGWFGSADDWHALVPMLDTDSFTYGFFDYRGYGRSRERDGAFTFEEAAHDVLALADYLGWERFSLIGHSMGGVAIQRVLLAAPARIERMAGVCAVPACGSRMDDARLAGFRAAVDDVERRAAIISFSTGNRLVPRFSAHLARESQRLSRADAFASFLPQWAANDFSAQVEGNTTPVRLFVGEHDPTITAELMKRTWLAWYPNATLETLANAGHYPMHETPAALATSLENWLNDA
ncbi:alpha/beta fold hydrolase [Paraburkholderia phenoliruptrix]|uniref:alpha/beta fold hydrolase n=1 Tax=Paraburkholderia phenoliruptrix TaxID=252970 RepID=UPI001C6E40F4|nr:alpha/beta hydrolase [Paraburkholderia phenoliruptrix]MBW9105414.1 alpha/beta hydrolase [Paraburkholderia phenoliruptrix]MBW9130092.1 alpha/beta hydrolase [Paraburkholderia ginsengiterrae]